MARPDLVLLGFGMGDGQQLTLEAEALLRTIGRAFVVGPTPRVRRQLRRLRVRSTDLTPLMDTDDPAVGYLAVADAILAQADADPPTVALFPGHPLVSNSLGRYLLVAAAERGIAAQAVPGLSAVDLLVSMTGLDIGMAGLQILDARRLAERSMAFSPAMPLALLEPAAVAALGDDAWRDLSRRLITSYPPSHPALLVAAPGSSSEDGVVSSTVGKLPETGPGAPAGAVLFIDRYVQQNGG
jgi:uncharacterized protein YabN with tetrapyrrole methylase and pyrophosphatase domain